MTNDAIEFFTIYDRPKDFPNQVVVRRWTVKDGQVNDRGIVAAGSTVDEVRDAIPGECYNLGRYQDDDPTVVEVWMR